MKIHRHHFVPLFVSLILLCVVGLASGKNLLSQIGDMMTGNKNDADREENPKENHRRRLLEEKGSSGDVDIDAATGTVQDTAAKKEATCDGQLASALVQANDEVTVMKKERDETLADRKLALEKINHLEKALTQSESNLIEERDARGAIEIEIATALKVEKDRSINELTLLKDEKDDIISSLKEESVQVLDQVTKKSQTELHTLKKGKDEIIKELESTLSSELEKAKKEKETMIVSLEADRDATVSKVITEIKDEIEHLKQDRDTKVVELTAAMKVAVENVEQDRDTKVTELTAAMKVAVENVEQDRDTKVTELTQTIHQAAEAAAEVLRTTKNEAKTYLLKQVTTIKDDLAQAKVEYDELLTEKNKKIKNLQEYTEKMLVKKSSAEQALYDAKLVSTSLFVS
jgi:DNA repair exonuclease SbcCD ATPase subunit